jgi:hypothetical protein
MGNVQHVARPTVMLVQVFREWTVERSDLLTERPAKALRRERAAAGRTSAALQGLPMSLSGDPATLSRKAHHCLSNCHAAMDRKCLRWLIVLMWIGTM